MKNELIIKYKLPKRPFLSGFLFFFGAIQNPFRESVESIKNTSVEDGLAQSWGEVSQSFATVFDEESRNIK